MRLNIHSIAPLLRILFAKFTSRSWREDIWRDHTQNILDGKSMNVATKLQVENFVKKNESFFVCPIVFDQLHCVHNDKGEKGIICNQTSSYAVALDASTGSPHACRVAWGNERWTFPTLQNVFDHSNPCD